MVSKKGTTEYKTFNKIWTKAAIDCYLIGCTCSKCDLFKYFFSKRKYKCQMKKTVLELIKEIGAPIKKEYDIQK